MKKNKVKPDFTRHGADFWFELMLWTHSAFDNKGDVMPIIAKDGVVYDAHTTPDHLFVKEIQDAYKIWVTQNMEKILFVEEK